MELVAQVQNREAVEAALAAGVNGISLQLPRHPDAGWWSAAQGARAAVQRQGARFYLSWEWLAPEHRWPEALTFLEAAARMAPEALVLRDLGLHRAARRLYPDLPLFAAGRWGCHNSLGLRQAADLGFQRVIIEAPLHLPELALMSRESSLPLQVAWTSGSRDFPGPGLLEEFLGVEPAWAMARLDPGRDAAAQLLAGLEMLPGLSQLGVEAVHLSPDFSHRDALKLLVPLFRKILAAAPSDRPQVLQAARQALTAFGASLRVDNPDPPPVGGREESNPSGTPAAPPRPPTGKFAGKRQDSPHEASSSSGPRSLPPERGLVWLEVRGFNEVAALGRNWRGPVVVPLTRENYQAFLPEHHLWEGRRLIWRLPAVIRQAAVTFYRQAVATLREGGYTRFIAGDWGAVALVRETGGRVYGDQTLGVRNLQALEAARGLGVFQVCLPPGGNRQEWQPLLAPAPSGSFWAYLLQAPVFAAFSREAAPPREGRLRGPAGEILRWAPEEDLLLLCPKIPQNLEFLQPWLQQQGVAPLIWSLPRTGLPWGQTPPPPEKPRREPGPKRPPPRRPPRS